MPDRFGALAPRRGIPSYPLLRLPSEGIQTWRVNFWTHYTQNCMANPGLPLGCCRFLYGDGEKPGGR